MKPKVSVETSVISYHTARPSRDLIVAGHQQATQDWWSRQLPQLDPHLSAIVLEEISHGDDEAAQTRLKAVDGWPSLEITPDVVALARAYFEALSLPGKARLDALHLALGVEHGMDYLVSWNFTHIVGARPRAIVETVNYRMGIRAPVICTPEELLEGDLS
jgi:predicted nucleic acid-binding protein